MSRDEWLRALRELHDEMLALLSDRKQRGYLLLESPALLEAGWPAAWRRPCVQAQRRQASARRRRINRGRVPLPRPQQFGSDDHLLAVLGGQEDKSWAAVAEAIGL